MKINGTGFGTYMGNVISSDVEPNIDLNWVKFICTNNPADYPLFFMNIFIYYFLSLSGSVIKVKPFKF